MISFLLAASVAVEPGIVAWKQVPIEATEDSVLFTQVSNQAVACTVELDLSLTGEVRFVTPLSCPDALFRPVRSALVQWRFHPPASEQEERGLKQKFTAVFEAATVVLDQKDSERYALVRVPPAAIPLWPHPPDKDEDLRALFALASIGGGSCVLETGVDKRGEPFELVIVDCPNDVARSIEKSLSRWGMKTLGAELGDSTHYRLEMHF